MVEMRWRQLLDRGDPEDGVQPGALRLFSNEHAEHFDHNPARPARDRCLWRFVWTKRMWQSRTRPGNSGRRRHFPPLEGEYLRAQTALHPRRDEPPAAIELKRKTGLWPVRSHPRDRWDSRDGCLPVLTRRACHY